MNKHNFVPSFVVPVRYFNTAADTELALSLQLNKESVKLVDILVPVRVPNEKNEMEIKQIVYTIDINCLTAAASALVVAARE